MFQAPSPYPNPVVRLAEQRALDAGRQLLRSGVYGHGALRMVVERIPAQTPLGLPLLQNLRVVPLSASVFSEVTRRVNVINVAGVVDAVLSGRVTSGMDPSSENAFVIEPGESGGPAKVHIPGTHSLQELPPMAILQWLELLVRGAIQPWEGRSDTPAWVARMRLQHVQLLGRVGERRLQWVEPQPAPL